MQKRAGIGNVLFKAMRKPVNGLSRFYNRNNAVIPPIAALGGITAGLGGIGLLHAVNSRNSNDNPFIKDQNYLNYVTEVYNREHPDAQKPYINLGSPWRAFTNSYKSNSRNARNKLWGETDLDNGVRYGRWQPKTGYSPYRRYNIPEGANVIPVEDYLNQQR